MSAGNLFPSYFGSGLKDLNNGVSTYHSIFFFLFFSIYCFFTILTLIFSAELENGSRGITSQTPDEFSCKYWTLEINCWFPARSRGTGGRAYFRVPAPKTSFQSPFPILLLLKSSPQRAESSSPPCPLLLCSRAASPWAQPPANGNISTSSWKL